MAPIALFKAKVYAPIKKADHLVHGPPGVKSYKFAGEIITLKAIPVQRIRRFVPKKLISPEMWRSMLKKTQQKAVVKAKEIKKERPAMKEIVLKAEKTIRIAQRDTLENYCNEFCKSGLPGKKYKPRKISRAKLHRSELKQAKYNLPGAGSKTAAKKVYYNIFTHRFEVYDSSVTIGDPKTMYAQFACFTLRLGDGPIEEMPEPTFEEVEVVTTINIPCDVYYNEDDEDEEE